MQYLGLLPVLLLVTIVTAEKDISIPEAVTNSSATLSNVSASDQAKVTEVPATAAPANKTTTAAPSNSTTPSPVPSPSSTSPNPTTTTTPPPITNGTVPPTPTPTPSPTPAPSPAPPKEYFWNVTDDQGINCILAKADIKLKLYYTNGSQEVERDFSIPSNASASGHCGNSSQTLIITFEDVDNIEITFTRSNNSQEYHVSEISSSITPDKKKNDTITLEHSPSKWFHVQTNTSYMCSWSQPATLEENDFQKNVTKARMQVEMRNVRLEAFRNSTGTTFSQAEACPVDTPDIVPIMVGIALGILVAVVLIAYLVGRHTRTQGYLSM